MCTFDEANSLNIELLNNWWELYDNCDDYLGLCSTASNNETHYEFTLDFASPEDQVELEWLPGNYYCRYSVALDDVYDWSLKVYRLFSTLNVPTE